MYINTRSFFKIQLILKVDILYVTILYDFALLDLTYFWYQVSAADGTRLV